MPNELSLGTMTDEELDKALGENQTATPAPETPDTPAETPAPATPAPTTPAPTPEPTPAPEQPVPEDPTKAELQKLQQQLREAQKFNGRLSNELGQLRQQVRQPAKPQTEEPTDEDFVANPKQAHERLIAARQEREQLERQERQTQAQMELASVRDTVSAAIPTFEQALPQIVEVLAKEDEVPPEWLGAFKQNPYALGTTGLYHLAKRAEATQKLAQANQRIADLERQLGEAKKTPGKMVDAINRGQRAFSAPTSSPNAAGPQALASLSHMDLAGASEEELDNLLALSIKEK